MTHASVFSGIGGSEVAAAMLGWENLFHCEINPFGRKVLDYWFPNSKSYEDITTTDFSEWRGRVNVLTGGFPCQPFSYAGQRRGETDDRYLWPFMHCCINQVRPDWVVCENVAGILTMVEQGEVSKMATQTTLFDEGDRLRRYKLRETFTLERICRDLESDGYSVQPILIPACAVGAPHRRDRVFIVGHRNDIIPKDTLRSRQLERHDEKLRSERNIGNTGARSGERICRKTSRVEGGGTSTDTKRWLEVYEHMESEQPNGAKSFGYGMERNVTDTNGNGQPSPEWENRRERQKMDGGSDHIPFDGSCGHRDQYGEIAGCGRWANFPSVSPVHRGNDGLPFSLDCLTIPPGKWRTEALKAYGNAIVPQVIYEIFRAIEEVEHSLKKQPNKPVMTRNEF